MLFTDEDSRHAYHKTPALLQVVCQILESRLAEHGVQLELVDCEKHGGMWVAAVCVDSEVHEAALLDSIQYCNRMFQRADDIKTVTLENDEVGLLSIRVTDTADFSLAQ